MGRDVILQTAMWKGVSGERRDFTDSARGKASVGRVVMLQTVQGGKGSLRRDVMLQTVQGERGRWGET